MSVLSSFQHNMMKPKYDKIEKDRLNTEHKNKIFKSKMETNHNTIVDMRSAMLLNCPTLSQEQLLALSEKKDMGEKA